MKTASVSELKNGLSAYLKEVIAGEIVVVTDRKRPVAMFRAIGVEDRDGELASLIASGIVIPPAGSLDLEAFFAEPKALVPGGLMEAIIEEREGR